MGLLGIDNLKTVLDSPAKNAPDKVNEPIQIRESSSTLKRTDPAFPEPQSSETAHHAMAGAS